MRPPEPLLLPGQFQEVSVRGELHDESGARPLTHAFEDRMAIGRRAGSVPLLHIRIDAERGVIDLDLRGSVHEDGLLTLTIALTLRHRLTAEEDEEIEAETTALATDSSTVFALVLRDDDGCCCVHARGSVTNGAAGRPA